MRLCKPSFEIIEQQSGLKGLYKQIELSGRVAYKSEDKITEDSYKGFVDRIIKLNHGSVLEHGTVYLLIPYEKAIDAFGNNWVREQYSYNPYSVVAVYDNNYYITTNMRVLVEHNWLDDLQYICEPTEHHEKRVCVRFICDRSISHEFVRHRTFSFLMESTRYCNYSKDKFNNEITFILPCWLNIPEGKYTNIAKQSNEDGEYKQIMLHENNINAYPLTTTSEGRFLWSCYWDEHNYFDLLNYGWKPQQARAVLPNSLKTELVMTGFISDWAHFFKLRDAGSAHPQAQELAKPLHEEFIKRGYIK